ncbi:MAG: hypothetical protein ACYT04_000000101865, partial [Nostoc sp.]
VSVPLLLSKLRGASRREAGRKPDKNHPTDQQCQKPNYLLLMGQYSSVKLFSLPLLPLPPLLKNSLP